MIDLVYNLLFRCPHRRLTRPITPVSKPGVPSGETYVVCLECGKQFYYDWDNMRIGKPIKHDAPHGVLGPESPKPGSTKLKYTLAGAALPLAVVAGRVLATTLKGLTAPRRHRKKAAGADGDPGEEK